MITLNEDEVRLLADAMAYAQEELEGVCYDTDWVLTTGVDDLLPQARELLSNKVVEYMNEEVEKIMGELDEQS